MSCRLPVKACPRRDQGSRQGQFTDPSRCVGGVALRERTRLLNCW
ncbi:MAG: hypothetical protein OXG70_06900 [Cyanobacteria bacterium MAG IRC1_bin_28]|nr:hypothetical protein [Cyanobacteria bacterium MAG IRC1_bin_28]